MRPHSRWFDSDTYWEIGFELVDELISACKPERYFHIGMDEDTDRSHRRCAAAVCTLAEGVEARKLQAVMWKDIDIITPGMWEAPGEKSKAARRPRPRASCRFPGVTARPTRSSSSA